MENNLRWIFFWYKYMYNHLFTCILITDGHYQTVTCMIYIYRTMYTRFFFISDDSICHKGVWRMGWKLEPGLADIEIELGSEMSAEWSVISEVSESVVCMSLEVSFRGMKPYMWWGGGWGISELAPLRGTSCSGLPSSRLLDEILLQKKQPTLKCHYLCLDFLVTSIPNVYLSLDLSSGVSTRNFLHNQVEKFCMAILMVMHKDFFGIINSMKSYHPSNSNNSTWMDFARLQLCCIQKKNHVLHVPLEWRVIPIFSTQIKPSKFWHIVCNIPHDCSCLCLTRWKSQ